MTGANAAAKSHRPLFSDRVVDASEGKLPERMTLFTGEAGFFGAKVKC
jgi:hypothetical protein